MTLTVYAMVRDMDVSGVSGVGHVGDVAVFPDGTAVLRWRGELVSTAIYPSMSMLREIHGHDGCTRFVERLVLDDSDERPRPW